MPPAPNGKGQCRCVREEASPSHPGPKCCDGECGMGELEQAGGHPAGAGEHRNTCTGEALIRAREEERYRLAREIHDGPAQALANIVLRAEVCERLLAAGRPEALQEVAQLKLLVKESLREVRRIIYDLRPLTLDELGLVPTLEGYFDYMRDRYGTPVFLHVVGERETRLYPAVEVAVFRTVQEAVNNAWKHAQASRIDVTLVFDPDFVAATVQDDGVGFNVEQVVAALATRRSYGLLDMRERIQLLGGEFAIESSEEKGTTVRFRVPRTPGG